jgi:S1-C subfamily serine protease
MNWTSNIAPFRTAVVFLALALVCGLCAAPSGRLLADDVAHGAGVARPASPSEEINTLLMHATFRIHGAARGDPMRKIAFGTVFVMGIPRHENPTVSNIVLVTAAHVLEDIAGDVATLMLRKPDPDGTYTEFPFDIPIRRGGSPLYTRHPTEDVAAMYADLPDAVPMSGLPPTFLATDEMLADIEVHPGDEAFVLGFPLGVGTPGGFPVLRTGRIASYPLTPMRGVKSIVFDLFLYGGNSGGPVYYSYSNRMYKGAIHFGVAQGILGLVIQQAISPTPGLADSPLNLGLVVPAVFIRETLDRLPPPPQLTSRAVPNR